MYGKTTFPDEISASRLLIRQSVLHRFTYPKSICRYLQPKYVLCRPLGLGPRETLLEGPLAAHQPTPANPLAAPVTVACRGMPRAALPALGTFLGHSGAPQRPILAASSLGLYSRIWVFTLPATPRIVPRVLFLQETVLLHSRGL